MVSNRQTVYIFHHQCTNSRTSDFWNVLILYVGSGLITWTLTMKYDTWKHSQTLFALISSILELMSLLIKLTEARAWKFVPYISLVPFSTMNNDMFYTCWWGNNYPHSNSAYQKSHKSLLIIFIPLLTYIKENPFPFSPCHAPILEHLSFLEHRSQKSFGNDHWQLSEMMSISRSQVGCLLLVLLSISSLTSQILGARYVKEEVEFNKYEVWRKGFTNETNEGSYAAVNRVVPSSPDPLHNR